MTSTKHGGKIGNSIASNTTENLTGAQLQSW